MEQQYNFTIADKPVKVLESAEVITYTILINRILKDNTFFENLVVEQFSDGEVRANIIKYTPFQPNIVQSYFSATSFNGNRTITPILYNDEMFSDPNAKISMYCYSVCVLICHDLVAGHADYSHPHTPDGGCVNSNSTTIDCTVTCWDTGGGGDGDDAGSGPPLDTPGGGGGPTGNNTPVGDPVNNCGHCNVPVYTAPVLEEEEIAPPKTPCEELQKLLNNTESVDALTFLEGKTSEDKEYGFAYEALPNSSDLDEVHPIESLPNQPLKLRMGNYIGGNFIGANHTHPRPSTSGAVPMFAADDIFWLYALSRAHLPGASNSQKDFSVYFLTLTVGSGTYAIKIKDNSKFLEFISNNYVEFKYSLERKFIELGQMTSASVLKKEFLKIINKNTNSGIGLYELNSDKTDWAELTFNPLSPNSDPGIKPCKTK